MNILSSHWYLKIRLKVLELRKLFSRSHGFTLMEIVIVIGITGILASAGYSSYVATQKNSRDGKRKADLETIRQALEMYKSENGSYPGSALSPAYEVFCDSSVGAIVTGNCNCRNGANIATACGPVGNNWSYKDSVWDSALYSGLVPNFIQSLPIDPQNSSTTYYYYEPVCNQTDTACGQSYTCTGTCCAYEIGAYQENTGTWYQLCNP